MRQYMIDTIEDNEHIKTVLINIAAAIALGFLVEYVTGLNESPFKGGLIVAFALIDMFGLLLVASSNMKDDKQYNIEELQSKAIEAESRADGATIAKDKANGLALQLNELLQTEQGLTVKLSNEVEQLRKNERTLIDKITNARQEVSNANDKLTSVQDKLADVQKNQAVAITDAKKEATNAIRPYSDAGTNYLLYALCKGISNPKSVFADDEKAKAREQGSAIKLELDAFVNTYKELGLKTLDI